MISAEQLTLSYGARVLFENVDIKFTPGEKVKVKEGNFENFEGEVSAIDEAHGRVTVMLSIFGRPTPVELEYWQVEGT